MRTAFRSPHTSSVLQKRFTLKFSYLKGKKAMKKTYLNPEAMIIEIASEDIVRTSDPFSLSIGNGTDMVNDGGFYDADSFTNMFG